VANRHYNLALARNIFPLEQWADHSSLAVVVILSIKLAVPLEL
jgi:hypothetical protein